MWGRMVRVLLVFCLLGALAVLPERASAAIGGQLFGTGGDISIEILAADAGYTSSLYLFSPEYRFIGTNREVGKRVTLAGIPAGQELVFGIVVQETGQTFRVGPGSRNPDGLAHADVTQLGERDFLVGFEDLFGGGDRDYNDNLFRFTGALAPVPVDNVAPVTAYTITPAPNAQGWIGQPATVVFSATDGAQAGVTPSGVARVDASFAGVDAACPPGPVCSMTIATTGAGVVAYSARDHQGNQEAPREFQLAVDLDPPTISGAPDRPANAAGWYDADVTVRFACADVGAGIASCTNAMHLGEGASQQVTGSAVDLADHVATVSVGGINVDKTAPVVAFSGNAGTYDLDGQVAILCTATDALSGIAWADCAPAVGPAYAFGVGAHSVHASAMDLAGNQASATASFTVTASSEGLCRLVQQWTSKSGIAHSLCQKLEHGVPLQAFVNEVQAQSGKAIAPEKAALLIQLASAL